MGLLNAELPIPKPGGRNVRAVSRNFKNQPGSTNHSFPQTHMKIYLWVWGLIPSYNDISLSARELFSRANKKLYIRNVFLTALLLSQTIQKNKKVPSGVFTKSHSP